MSDEAMPTPWSCCEIMNYQLAQKCEQHRDPFDCPDVIVMRQADGSFGMPIRDGGSSYLAISFCPWCGAKLPTGGVPAPH